MPCNAVLHAVVCWQLFLVLNCGNYVGSRYGERSYRRAPLELRSPQDDARGHRWRSARRRTTPTAVVLSARSVQSVTIRLQGSLLPVRAASEHHKCLDAGDISNVPFVMLFGDDPSNASSARSEKSASKPLLLRVTYASFAVRARLHGWLTVTALPLSETVCVTPLTNTVPVI